MSWGPLGVFVFSAIDSLGIPMVGGVDAMVVLVAALDHSAAYFAAAAATVGSLFGSMLLFYVARRGGEAYLQRYTATGRGAKFRTWFAEYGVLTVFVPAFVIIPMPLKVFVLSAGALGTRPQTFFFVLAAARIPRYLLLAWLGMRLGKETLPYMQHHIWQLFALAVLLFVILYAAMRITRRMRAATK